MKDSDSEPATHNTQTFSAQTFDAARWLSTTAPALDIPVIDAHRPGVITNLDIAAQMAARLFTVSVEDDIDIAPVFQPELPAAKDPTANG